MATAQPPTANPAYRAISQKNENPVFAPQKLDRPQTASQVL
jgi:hypothetical protein